MHIAVNSYDAGGRIEFYCYLKSASGAIAEAVGSSFIRSVFNAAVKLFRTIRKDAIVASRKGRSS